MNMPVPMAVLHIATARGTRRVRTSVRTMTSSAVTITRRRHRAAHHMAPAPRTINGNLRQNENGLSGPAASTMMDSARPSSVQMTHAVRCRAGVRHHSRMSEVEQGAIGGCTVFKGCAAATAHLPVRSVISP